MQKSLNTLSLGLEQTCPTSLTAVFALGETLHSDSRYLKLEDAERQDVLSGIHSNQQHTRG